MEGFNYMLGAIGMGLAGYSVTAVEKITQTSQIFSFTDCS